MIFVAIALGAFVAGLVYFVRDVRWIDRVRRASGDRDALERLMAEAPPTGWAVLYAALFVLGAIVVWWAW